MWVRAIRYGYLPKCGSSNVTKISRMNGYLGYTRIHGKSRYNKAKMAEISERLSM